MDLLCSHSIYSLASIGRNSRPHCSSIDEAISTIFERNLILRYDHPAQTSNTNESRLRNRGFSRAVCGHFAWCTIEPSHCPSPSRSTSLRDFGQYLTPPFSSIDLRTPLFYVCFALGLSVTRSYTHPFLESFHLRLFYIV